MPALPDLLADAQTTEERFLRHIFVRDQMAEWSKYPLVMARADGVHYWDVTGKRYLDALSGIYVVSVGHNNRRVIDAIRAQFDTLCFSPPMHGTNPLAVQLATLLAELAPGDLSAVKFQCGGVEVTEAAIKLARQYHRLTGHPGKYKVVSRYLSWHGSTLGSLWAAGHTGGIIDPPPEYLPILREVCDRYNVLLIFDEIITGAGRTGHLFAAETFGVVPDVLCTAKGLSGGYAPLSAMICREPIAESFWGPASENPGFVEGHTFEGNPLSCAAGLAVLREIIERDLCGNARAQGARLRQRFEGLARKYPEIGDVRGKGLFQGIELVRDRATKARFPDSIAVGVKVGRRALEHGLLCRFDPHWIAFGPPLVVTAEQIGEMVGILDRSVGEVLEELGEAR